MDSAHRALHESPGDVASIRRAAPCRNAGSTQRAQGVEVMLDAGQRVTSRVMTDFVAAAGETPGFCKRDDATIAHAVRPGEALCTWRRSVRWRCVGNPRVGYGNIVATRLLVQCAFRHLAGDGFARQTMCLYGRVLYAEEARLARRGIRNEAYVEARPASWNFSETRCDLPRRARFGCRELEAARAEKRHHLPCDVHDSPSLSFVQFAAQRAYIVGGDGLRVVAPRTADICQHLSNLHIGQRPDEAGHRLARRSRERRRAIAAFDKQPDQRRRIFRQHRRVASQRRKGVGYAHTVIAMTARAKTAI